MALTLSVASLSPAAARARAGRSCPAGNDRAFEELYARYRGRICAFIQGRSATTAGPRTSPKRCSSRRCAGCAPPSRPIAFKPWIYEIAKNACIDEFRRGRRARRSRSTPTRSPPRRGRCSRGSDAPEPRLRPSSGSTICAAPSAACPRATIRSSCMREFEGLSYDQIGERIGMSRQMVESTLFRARRKLSEEYDELGQRPPLRADPERDRGRPRSVSPGFGLARAPAVGASPRALPALPSPRPPGRRRRVAAEAAQHRRQDRRAAALPAGCVGRSVRRPGAAASPLGSRQPRWPRP